MLVTHIKEANNTTEGSSETLRHLVHVYQRSMKFAIDLHSRNRIEAAPGAKGICINCKKMMVPKCGSYRIHHWAHKSVQDCDHWWEHETEWHRSWKDRFPAHWQEYIMHDSKTGEKHIADVFNPSKQLVIEFQNSRINREEILAREQFYRKMLWLLNGEKLCFEEITSLWHDSALEKLEARVSSAFRKSYREKKLHTEREVSELRKQEELLNDALRKERIVYDEWRQSVTSINDTIRKLRTDLQAEKQDTKHKAEAELWLECYNPMIRRPNNEQTYIIYNWRYRSPAWDEARSPIFVHFEGKLLLLKTKYVALTVSMEKFLTKYSTTS